jgi:hypothetical protein
LIIPIIFGGEYELRSFSVNTLAVNCRVVGIAHSVSRPCLTGNLSGQYRPFRCSIIPLQPSRYWAEYCSWNPLPFYSGDARFVSRPGHLPSWPRFFRGVRQSHQAKAGIIPRISKDRFLPSHFKFILLK